jgi:hypothetical protein
VKSSRILSVIFLTTIYCFGLGVVTKSFAHSDFHSDPTSAEEIIISDYSQKLFCHTSQIESSVNSLNNLPVTSFKFSFVDVSAIAKTTEQVFETEFSQYTTLSKDNLVNHRKSDIIFPFHYFW